MCSWILTDHYSAQESDRCDSGQKKHIFSKREQKSLLPTISVLPLCSQSAQLFQPLATRAEAWQAIPGVSTWIMNDYGKTRLYTQFTQIPPRLRGVLHHSAQRECSGPPRRGDESAGKRSHRNRSSSPEQVRLLQQLHPRPQKDSSLRPILDLRLLNYALMKRSFRMITLKQILLQICPGTGSCRWIWGPPITDDS